MKNRSEAVLAVLDASKPQEYVPRRSFCISTRSIISAGRRWRSTWSYFRYTGMDFVKIQFELPFPRHPEIQRPEDWAKMPLYGKEFYQPQLEVVEGLVREARREALVLLTLSPFMLAGQAVGAETVEAHIRENPEAAKRGIGIIAESLMTFVQECIRLGGGWVLPFDPGRRGQPPGWQQALRGMCQAVRPAADERDQPRLRLQHPAHLRLPRGLR